MISEVTFQIVGLDCERGVRFVKASLARAKLDYHLKH